MSYINKGEFLFPSECTASFFIYLFSFFASSVNAGRWGGQMYSDSVPRTLSLTAHHNAPAESPLTRPRRKASEMPSLSQLHHKRRARRSRAFEGAAAIPWSAAISSGSVCARTAHVARACRGPQRTEYYSELFGAGPP